MTTIYKFKAYYTDAGVGAVQDPAPTCTVINMANDAKLADAQATTASTNMPGLYSYEYSGADGLDCVAWFKTTDTGCDVKELASYVSEKITTNLNADVAGVETKLDTVDANVDAILTDTGTDGVKIADGAITASKFDESTAYPLKSADTGSTQVARVGADSDTLETLSDEIAAVKAETAAILVDTGTTLDGNITAILADTNELQTDLVNGGRLDLLIDSIIAHLVAIKGAGWTNETLAAIYEALSSGFGGASVEDTINSIIVPLAGVGWTNQTLVAIKSAIDLLATAANLATLDGKADAILEDTGTTLDTLIKDIPTNTELATALGTADDAVLAAVAAAKSVIDNIHDTDLPAVKTETAAIKAKTDNLPASPAPADEYDVALAALDTLIDGAITKIDAIDTIVDDLHDTDIPAIPTAAEVWSSPIRTLTVPAVAIASNVDGTTLSLYKDADINIEFTGLTIPSGSKKVVFTIKDNLDDADTVSALQATYQLVAPSTETHTLNYINSAVPTGLTNPVTFTVDTDSVEFDMTAAAAYYLPRYERGYLHWDLKLITATTVQILQQGLVQILGTSTRTVA